jgi:hypothetical protein
LLLVQWWASLTEIHISLEHVKHNQFISLIEFTLEQKIIGIFPKTKKVYKNFYPHFIAKT